MPRMSKSKKLEWSFFLKSVYLCTRKCRRIMTAEIYLFNPENDMALWLCVFTSTVLEKIKRVGYE